jgi:UrcA family protein
MKNIMIFAVALALAAPAASFAASADGQAPTLSVSYRGLDLSQPQGAKRMIARLDKAAAEVCGASSFSARDYQRAVRSSACYQDSMNRAVATLASPTVNAVYRERALTVASN